MLSQWRAIAIVMSMLLTCITGGCGIHWVYIPDTDREKFVSIRDVRGRMVTTTDGVQHVLAGVRCTSPGTGCNLEWERYLSQLRGAATVFVEPIGASEFSVIVLSQYAPPDRNPNFGVRKNVPLYPKHRDMSYELIWCGQAFVAPEELGQRDDLRPKYREAETQAREAGRGVWRH